LGCPAESSNVIAKAPKHALSSCHVDMPQNQNNLIRAELLLRHRKPTSNKPVLSQRLPK
jgi:hypothetical protein